MFGLTGLAVVIAFVAGVAVANVKHSANLKLSAVKAEIAKIESEIAGQEAIVFASKAVAVVVARIKAAL